MYTGPVVVVAVLFAGTGSLVADVTLAVLTIGFTARWFDGTLKVDVIVRTSPGGIVPSAHGNTVTQSPALDTNVSPGGVGSATIAPDASLGPPLVTGMTYEMFAPGVAPAGPLLVMARSPDRTLTGVVAVAVLSVRSPSLAVVVTVAVLEMGLGVE